MVAQIGTQSAHLTTANAILMKLTKIMYLCKSLDRKAPSARNSPF